MVFERSDNLPPDDYTNIKRTPVTDSESPCMDTRRERRLGVRGPQSSWNRLRSGSDRPRFRSDTVRLRSGTAGRIGLKP